MRKINYIFVFICFCAGVKGQVNLVPNPSFESYTSCPTGQAQVIHAVDWISTRSTPDYFNTCALNASGVSVPVNDGGFQFGASGNGYVGIYAYYPSNPTGRESFGCQLISTLTVGTKYFVSFKASLCNIDSSLGYCISTDHLGALFSTAPYSSVSPTPTNNFAHVYSNTIIQDTLNWTKIFGSFIPASPYQYLAIGNFFDDATTNKFYFFVTPQPVYASYYYIDDICVSTDSIFCANWGSVGMKENNFLSTTKAYPNPFSDFVEIDLNRNQGQMFSFKLYNCVGKVVRFQEGIMTDKIIIKREYLEPGIYFLRLFNQSKTINEFIKLIIE